MAKDTQKNEELPVYLAKIRTELILQISKLGFSFQDVADIFSKGISKSRVFQIIKKNKLTKTTQDSQKS